MINTLGLILNRFSDKSTESTEKLATKVMEEESLPAVVAALQLTRQAAKFLGQAIDNHSSVDRDTFESIAASLTVALAHVVAVSKVDIHQGLFDVDPELDTITKHAIQATWTTMPIAAALVRIAGRVVSNAIDKHDQSQDVAAAAHMIDLLIKRLDIPEEDLQAVAIASIND